MTEETLLLRQAKSLLGAESDYIANAANLSALIYSELEDINWVGFYFLRDQALVLGPFQGEVACTRIDVGKGVCGTAFEQQTTLIVDDVDQFAGHIACDSRSRSELVVPFKRDELAGVLDIDSPLRARFSEEDARLFEAMIGAYVQSIGN